MKWIKTKGRMINLNNILQMILGDDGVYFYNNEIIVMERIFCDNIVESNILLDKIHAHIDSPDTTLDLT
jgi:hypothetical protein